MFEKGNIGIQPFKEQDENSPDNEDNNVLDDGDWTIVDDPADNTPENKVLYLVYCRTWC